MNIPETFAGYKLDHIGIAVENLENGFRFYEALGFKTMNIEIVENEKVRVGMLELTNQSRIELLEPLNKTGPVQKFLDQRGPGIHHIALRVQDLRSTLKNLKDQNIRLVHQEPQPGAHQCLIAFVHPRATGGVLIELTQKVNP